MMLSFICYPRRMICSLFIDQVYGSTCKKRLGITKQANGGEQLTDCRYGVVLTFVNLHHTGIVDA